MDTDILTSFFSNMNVSSESSSESEDENYEQLVRENYELSLKLNTVQTRLADKAELLQTHELRRFAKRLNIENYRKLNHIQLVIALKKHIVNK